MGIITYALTYQHIGYTKAFMLMLAVHFLWMKIRNKIL